MAMKYVDIFESFSNFPSGKSSRWPKQKHNRGVKVIRSLSHVDDRDEIIDLIKKYYKEKGWFEHDLKKNNIDSPDYKIPYDTHWFEIMRPDGKNEVVFFDDFDGGFGDSAEDGFVSATTFDEKYEFTMGAYNYRDEVEVDPDTLDW
jgi:hypothetical protein